MDSLADMVSFGAAPALITYEWALKEAKELLLEYDKKNGVEVIKGDWE